MAEDQLSELREQFKAIDQDGTGLILASELKDILKEKDPNHTSDEIDKIIMEVDYYGNGKINYSEFLAATLDMKKFLT